LRSSPFSLVCSVYLVHLVYLVKRKKLRQSG
jgi:hypothetical protein